MHSHVNSLARVSAVLGGIVLVAMIVLTCLSILGRSINSLMFSDFFQDNLPQFADLVLSSGVGHINGDFELIEAGMAFSIFAFLPLCQLMGGHASVTILADRLPSRLNRGLVTVIEVLFAATLILITWQLFLGMESKRMSGQTSFLLQFPVWWAYALSLVPSIVAALVATYVAAARVIERVTGKKLLSDQPGAIH